MELRRKEEFFSYFKIDYNDLDPHAYAKVSISWKENYEDADLRKLGLRLHRFERWKIFAADWQTESLGTK